MFDQATNSMPQYKNGAIKAFAVTSPTRLASAPDVPTVDEAGLPGLYISYWHGIWAPKSTPKEIVAKLNAAVVAALANPAVKQRFRRTGAGNSTGRGAIASSTRRLPEGRDRESGGRS